MILFQSGSTSFRQSQAPLERRIKNSSIFHRLLDSPLWSSAFENQHPLETDGIQSPMIGDNAIYILNKMNCMESVWFLGHFDRQLDDLLVFLLDHICVFPALLTHSFQLVFELSPIRLQLPHFFVFPSDFLTQSLDNSFQLDIPDADCFVLF